MLLATAAALWFAMPYVGPADTSLDDHLASDLWDPRAARLDSMDAVQRALPAFVVDTGQRKRDEALAIIDIVQRHFVHGIARQSWRTNWIANVADRFAPDRVSFSGMMDPDELLRQNLAFCSQATLVTQALFARQGIRYATVSFDDGSGALHSALAGKPDGVWRLYDPSLEPSVQGMPFGRVLQGDTIQALYARPEIVDQGRQFQDLVRRGKLRLVEGGPPNRGLAVQWLTRMLSNWGWVALALLAVSRSRRSLGSAWRRAGAAVRRSRTGRCGGAKVSDGSGVADRRGCRRAADMDQLTRMIANREVTLADIDRINIYVVARGDRALAYRNLCEALEKRFDIALLRWRQRASPVADLTGVLMGSHRRRDAVGPFRAR